MISASLNESGFLFMRLCLREIERKGLGEQGLYRNCGVNSKVQKLLQMGLDKRKLEKLDLNDDKEWELRTVTSAVKTFLRYLGLSVAQPEGGRWAPPQTPMGLPSPDPLLNGVWGRAPMGYMIQ